MSTPTTTSTTPAFTRNEINLIADTLNGLGTLLDSHESLWQSPYLGEPHPGYTSSLHAEISDAIKLNAADEKWSVDPKTILEKIAALPHREQCRIVLNVAAAWDNYTDEKKWDAILDSISLA